MIMDGPFRMRILLGLAIVSVLLGCQTNVAAAQKRLFPRLQITQDAHAFNDTRFAMTSCELTPDRSAICKLTVANKYRDKKIEISRGITIQDNEGNEYAVNAGGFGSVSNQSKWNQIAVADSDYQLTVIATNLSSQATSVRAVVFPRLLVRSTQGQTLGYRDQVVFSNPVMVASTKIAAPDVASASDNVQDVAPFPNADQWIVVGLWNYDTADGQHLPANGMVLRNAAGSNLGQHWVGHLELKNHAALRLRDRSLWPVSMNAAQRKVCADYPGYPSYPAFIDFPGDAADGIYHVSECKGGTGERP